MMPTTRAELEAIVELLGKLEHRALALCLCAINAGAANDELVRTTLELLASDAQAFHVRRAADSELGRFKEKKQ